MVERFITRSVPEIKEGSVTVRTGEETLVLTYPDTVSPTVTEYDFLMHRGEQVKVYAIDLTVNTPEKEITLKFEMR